jgi:hypothetical protein
MRIQPERRCEYDAAASWYRWVKEECADSYLCGITADTSELLQSD